MAFIWGVDSAAAVTKQLYDCVLTNFGKPLYWGRYLTTIPNVADGLTKEEVLLLKNSGTKVMPIYSNFRDATGDQNGRVVARNMIFLAKKLGIPKGKILFANIEKYFEVDDAWIRAFVDILFTSDYKPGIYFDSVQGNFINPYCEAVKKDSRVADQIVLWSARPETGISKSRQAPKFRPVKPPCKANVWGWQYGRDSEVCSIDTNLIDQRLFDMLW